MTLPVQPSTSMTKTDQARELQYQLNQEITDLVKAVNSRPQVIDDTNIVTVTANLTDHMGKCFLLVDQLTNLVSN